MGRKLRLALMLGLATAACGRSTNVETAPILVDIGWELDGGKLLHRAVWMSGDDEVAGTRWQEFEIEPDPDDDGAAWSLRCTQYRDRGYALSEEAFDRLQSASQGALPADEHTREKGRKNHLVIPSPDQSRVFIAAWRDGQRGIIELPAAREVGWPQDLPWGSGHKASANASWSGDGTRLALMTADEVDGSPMAVRIVVIDVVRGLTLHNITTTRGVSELAWSPDGQRLAVLTRETRLEPGPIEHRAGSFVHGRRCSDIYVQVIDLASGEVAESLLARDLPEDSSHIIWDPRAVTARIGSEEP